MIFGNRYFNELSINGEEQNVEELEDPEDNQETQNDDTDQNNTTVDAGGDDLPDLDEQNEPPAEANPEGETIDAGGDDLPDPDEQNEPPAESNPEGETIDADGDDNNLDLPDDTGGDTSTDSGEASIDASDGTELNTDYNEEGDDNNEEENSAEPNENEINNNTDDENPNLYSDLTPEQMKIKSLELKSNFNSLFMTSDNIVNKIGDVPKNSDNVEVMKRIMKICIELKDSIEHYILNNFNISSYIDNLIMFKKYLTILNSIKKTMADIEKEMVDKLGDNAKEITSESIHIIESLSLLHVM